MSSDSNNNSKDSTNQTTLYVQCHCKKQTISFKIPKKSFPLRTELCHCDDDRKVTGLMGLDYLQIKDELRKDLFDPKLPPKGLRSFTISNNLFWWFCSTCGCHLVQHTKRTDEERKRSEKDQQNVQYNWYASSGVTYPNILQDGTRVWERSIHIFVKPERDIGGLARFIPDGLPRFSTYGNFDIGNESLKPLPPTKTYSDHTSTKEEEEFMIKWRDAKTLPFSCACGYVQLELQRPNVHEIEKRFQDISDSTGKKWEWKICPCNSCRTTTGFEGGVGIIFPTFHHIITNTKFDEEKGKGESSSILKGYDLKLLEGDSEKPATKGLVLYNSSDQKNNRRFCPNCGASVFIDFVQFGPELCDIFLGLVDAPLRAVFDSWLFPAKKLGFLDFCRDRKLANQLNEGFCPGIDCSLPERAKSKVHGYKGELELPEELNLESLVI